MTAVYVLLRDNADDCGCGAGSQDVLGVFWSESMTMSIRDALRREVASIGTGEDFRVLAVDIDDCAQLPAEVCYEPMIGTWETVSGTYCSKYDQTIHLSGPEGWPEVTR